MFRWRRLGQVLLALGSGYGLGFFISLTGAQGLAFWLVAAFAIVQVLAIAISLLK